MYATMATQKLLSSFLRTGLMVFLLLIISNMTFADTTVATKQGLPFDSPNESETSAFQTLETKVSFLEESIGRSIKESDFPLAELHALRDKLENSKCKNMDIIMTEMKNVSFICLLPEGFCEQRDRFLNFIHDLNDVDKKLLPYLVCFIEPSIPGDKVKQRFLKRMSNADKEKTEATLQKVNDEILSERKEHIKSFLETLPQNFILNSDVLIKRRNSNRSSYSSTPIKRLITRQNTNRPLRTVAPSSSWATRRGSNRPFRTQIPSDHWITRRSRSRPFRTTTPMNKRGTQKPKKNLKENSKWKLLQKFLNDNVTVLPDLSIFNEVPFQRLLKIPRKKLCNLLPTDLQALNLTQVKKIIIYKQCQEELQEIASTVPRKLGKLISLLKRKDIVNLKSKQLEDLAAVVCQFESLMDTKMERLLAKMVLPVRVFKKDEDPTKFIKETSCLLKYIKPSDLRQIKLSGENKKFFCKMVGASYLKKLPEGEVRNLTKYCMKEVLRDKMELSELGNLLNYVTLNDIRSVTESQLLSWASILQHFLDSDEEIQYTGKILNKKYKDSLSDMTAEDLKKVGVFVGSWDSKDRKKIPSESWTRAMESFVTTCQKMDIENNNNFKFCYKIIPFILKAREKTQFNSNLAFSRVKRESSQTQASLTCKNIAEIKSLVKTLTVEQIKSISKEEFVKCIQVFGKTNNFTSEQLQSLMVLVNMTFGPAKYWSAENITDLGTLISALPLNQIKYMNFSDVNIIENLGKFPGFMKHQLNLLFGNWLNFTKFGNAAKINLTDIKMVGNLLCGISKTDLEKLSPQVILDALENIGKLGSCNITKQRMLLDKVIASIEKINPQWSPELLTSLGPLIRFLNGTTLEKLTASDLQNVSIELIGQIPALQAAAFKEIILPRLNNLANVSEVQMLVAILCETKSVTNQKSLMEAIQNLMQNNLTCTPKERNMLLTKLLNSSSANVTDIFKRVVKNITSLIEKPRRSNLEKLTREQIITVIDAVVQKIPTTRLDALLKKWLSDWKIRTTKEIIPLDYEVLALLACGLSPDIEKIDETDVDYIWKALNAEEISFSCTAEEQKQWLRKNFQSVNNTLHRLARSNGFEIDSIMGILKKLESSSATSLLNLEKELMEKINVSQTNPELKKLMLGIINTTEMYFGNASVLRVTRTLCHISVTDIMKIDEDLLKKFSEGKYKECTPSEEKAWLAAIINSTMHKLIELDSNELQTLMTHLDSLLKSNEALSNIIGMVTDITHLQVNELLKMLLNDMKIHSRSPEYQALQSLSSCLGKTDASQLRTLSTVEKFKFWVDNCTKPLKNLENLMNSTAMKLANMTVSYLYSMRAMFGQLDPSEMLKKWKIYETISSLPLTNASAINATFEKWLKELKLQDISVNTSTKHVILSFLACNLELDIRNLKITPENIIKAVEKFVRGESCSPELQRKWLSENSNIISKVVNNLANVLKNMTNYEGRDKDGTDDKSNDSRSDDGKNVDDKVENKNGGKVTDSSGKVETATVENTTGNNDNKKEDDNTSNSGNDSKNVDDRVENKNGGNVTGSSGKNVTMEKTTDNKTKVEDGKEAKDGGDGGDGMQGDQPKNDETTNDSGNTDEKPNPIISGGGSMKERLAVKDDFPFSAESVKKEPDQEFVKKLWDFTRSPASQKEVIILQMAIKKVLKFLLKNDKILNEYMDKDRRRVLKLADKVKMRREFLAKTKVDEKFLSSVSSVDSEAEAQTILAEAMKNFENKSKTDFIKLLPRQVIKKSGLVLINKMFNDETKDELIKNFQPKTETETVSRTAKKAVKEEMSLSQIGLTSKLMKTKPDVDTLNMIVRSSLLGAVPPTQFNELPENVLCDKDIAINELKMDQVLTMFKKCSSMVKKLLKDGADKLGILTTKVTKDMLNELDADQTSVVVQEACKHENDLNIDAAKSFFTALKEKGVNVIKDSNKASCTIKYAVKEIKDIDVKSDSNVENVCKNLGNSMNEKMSKESGKMFKDICFKLVMDKKLSFEEFGNLIYFLEASDIKELDEEQLLEAAQILSQSVQNKLVFEEISNRLKKVSSLSNSANLTPDDIALTSIFIGGWNDIDKIPKANLDVASMLLAETLKMQMLLKKSCIKETNDEAACSQLDPYLKKVVEVLVSDQPKRRRKRRSTTACDCELPSQLGTAAEMISPESLKQMLCQDNFLTCMEKLSVVNSWTSSHQAVFAEKAKAILSSPTTTKWSESNLKSVVPAIPGLSVDEIKSLDLNTVDLAFALGSQITWGSDKLKATFDVLYKKLLNSNNSYITSLELQTFRNLLCGMNTDIIQTIKSKEYLNAARELGNIDCFTNEQHKLWVKKAKDVYQDVDKWTDSTIASLGAVISGLPAEDLQKLTSTQIMGILPDTIPKIAPESLKNFHPNQFRSMTTSQIQKITAAQKSELNSEQKDIIEAKLEYINQILDKNNSDGSRSNLNIPVIFFSILLLILY